MTGKVSAEPKYQETLKKQNLNLIYEDGLAFESVLRDSDALFKRLVPTLQVTSK